MRKFVLMSVCAVCSAFLVIPASAARKKVKKETKKQVKSEEFVKINLNTALAYDLEKLPGISKAKAKRIVNYREENGDYESIDDLKQINHETRSSRISYDFATKSGKWRKAMRILVEADIFTLKGGTDIVDQKAVYIKLYPNPVDINSASLDELKALPGISNVSANRIIDNRPFSSIDDLKDISHETRSGRTRYGFVKKNGEWRKAIKPVIESKRLICSKSKKSKEEEEKEEEEDYENEY